LTLPSGDWIADWSLPTDGLSIDGNRQSPLQIVSRQSPIESSIATPNRQSAIANRIVNRQSKSSMGNLQSVNLQSAVGNLQSIRR
jgi:hypothetical protein